MSRRVLFFLAPIVIGAVARAEPPSDACRRALPADLKPVSQISTKVRGNRSLLACLGENAGEKSIVIVAVDPAGSKVVVSSRSFIDGEADPERTHVYVNGELIPHPIYTRLNPIRYDALLKKSGMVAIDSRYEGGRELGDSHSISEFYADGKNEFKYSGSIDDASWADGGDSLYQTSKLVVDAGGPLLIQRSLATSALDADADQLSIVQYRFTANGLVAVSTRTCVNINGNPTSPRQTASVTISAKFCQDELGKKCENHPGLPVRILRSTAGEDGAGNDIDIYEVQTLDRRRGFVPLDGVMIDCPEQAAGSK